MRVTIITGLRIGALGRVDSPDLTYNESYLGLLSTLGALLSIITSCATSLLQILRTLMRQISDFGRKLYGFVEWAKGRESVTKRVEMLRGNLRLTLHTADRTRTPRYDIELGDVSLNIAIPSKENKTAD